jgi:Ca-activated chloride channel family protein
LPFTTDTNQLLRSVDRIQAGGSTALFDAVHLAVAEMHHARYPRKALLIVSDGMDNHSRYTERETKRLISEIDFPIYTINLWQPEQGNRYAIQRRDPGVLEAISNAAGGRQYSVRDLKRLAEATEFINLEIRLGVGLKPGLQYGGSGGSIGMYDGDDTMYEPASVILNPVDKVRWIRFSNGRIY